MLFKFNSNLLKIFKGQHIFRNLSLTSFLKNKGEETHFGYETVTEEEKAEKVYHVFENVASKYDLMNDTMSFGLHRLWKDYFVNRLAPTPHTQLIDVAGGTGDIAFRFIKNVNYANRNESGNVKETQLPKAHVTVVDINQAMLDVGKEKAKEQNIIEGISWIKSDAEQLPFDGNKFDAYTIAFGIRNCVHIDKVLSEAYRVLKPGGRFMCLEFSQVKTPLISNVYDWYSFQLIPVLGQVIAGDWNSYQYLVESIRKFPNQQDFAEMIRSVGFKNVSFENLSFGIVAIHSGFKL